MGTVEYMSPEQAEDTRVADARSDIYSLGCTLYRLVTGIAPFARDTVVKTILAHRDAKIPTLGDANNPQLARLNPLFSRMVAKNPDERIQTATMLVQEIRQLTENADWESTQVLADTDVEIVRHGSSEYPTMVNQSTDESGIAYTSEVQQTPPGMVPPSDPSAPAQTFNPVPHSGSIDQPTTAFQNSTSNFVGDPPMSKPTVVRGKRHRGWTILVMGIFSIALAVPCFIGAILGVITVVYAQTDLREMKQGIRDPAGQNLTNAGRVLGYISCIIGFVYFMNMLSS
jgi:serine/threonine-protein kinase